MIPVVLVVAGFGALVVQQLAMIRAGRTSLSTRDQEIAIVAALVVVGGFVAAFLGAK